MSDEHFRPCVTPWPRFLTLRSNISVRQHHHWENGRPKKTVTNGLSTDKSISYQWLEIVRKGQMMRENGIQEKIATNRQPELVTFILNAN